MAATTQMRITRGTIAPRLSLPTAVGELCSSRPWVDVSPGAMVAAMERGP